jgi:UDP-glucuronate decarboxylase
MRTILVTGGCGNIGSMLVEKLLENKDNRIVICDDLSTGKKVPTDHTADWNFVKCNVNVFNDFETDFEELYDHQFDYIFHLAAVVGVKRTQDDPLSVLKDIDGFYNVFELARRTKVKRIFFSSSSEVYGEPVEIPQNEERTPLNSRVPYAVVKNMGEVYCKSYQKQYGLDYTIFRLFNTYGPNQSTDFVVPRFIASAKKGEDITIYGDGSQTRTFTYVDDTIDTFVKCLYADIGINDIINVGSDKMFTVLELAQMVIRLCNSKSKIVFLPPLKEGDMTRRQPDNTKMRAILGRELLGIEEGIIKLI